MTTCWLSSYPLRDELSVIKVVSFILERQEYNISSFAFICLLVAALLSQVASGGVSSRLTSSVLVFWIFPQSPLQDFQLPSPAFLSTGRPYVGGPSMLYEL